MRTHALKRLTPALCVMLGLVAAPLGAADGVVDRATAISTPGLFSGSTAAASGTIQASMSFGGSSISKFIKHVVHSLSDQIQDTAGSVQSAIVYPLTDTVVHVLSTTVTIRKEIGVNVSNSFTSVCDHRPEWLADPPWWFQALTQRCIGVDITTINNAVDLTLAASRGDWTQDQQCLLLTTVVNEGLVQVKMATQDAITSATAPAPVLGVVINCAVEYGFDRAEDKIDNRISQHFKPDGTGATTADTLQSQGKPIEVDMQDGIVLPAVTVANVITLGGATNGHLTVVTASDGVDKPAYYVSCGGAIIVKPETLLVGTVVLTTVPGSTIPDEVRTRASTLLQNDSTTPWVDNLAQPASTPTSGG